MSSYIYKVTAERVKLYAPVRLSDGRVMTEANVGKYAYKPYIERSEEDEKENRRMAKQAAVHVAERFVKGPNYTGLVCAGGIRVYEWKYGTYEDDWLANSGRVVGLADPTNSDNIELFEYELKKLRERQVTE